MGDPPVTEDVVVYARRGDRPWASRLVQLPSRPTTKLTVVAGPHDGHPLVLFTAYGGPPAPMEPWEIGVSGRGFEESVKFWSEHALSAEAS